MKANPVAWIADWRNLLTVGFSVLVGVFAFSYFDARSARDEAFDALRSEVTRGDALGEQVSALSNQVVALRDQLLKVGVEPTVQAPASKAKPAGKRPATTRRAPSASTTSATTTTTTDPPPRAPPEPPTTTTTRPCSVSIPGVCL